MTQYIVSWRILIEADTPREAAARALEIQRDPLSTAIRFTVEGDGAERSIDLLLDEADEG